MWFYTQELRRYDDPRNAIREQAAIKTAQRNARLAAMQWYGLSNSRPMTGVDCLHGVYAPRWVSNGYNPAEWVGAAGATTIYYAPAQAINLVDIAGVQRPPEIANSSHNPLAHRPHRRLRSIGHADLSQNVLHVFFDGFVADLQRLRDFFVCQSQRQLVQHFTFACVRGTSTSVASRGVASAPVTRRNSSRVQMFSPLAVRRMASNNLSLLVPFNM